MKQVVTIIFLFTSILTFGQNLKGKITDQHKNPIQDVFISNFRSGSHGHSNEFGDFVLDNVSIGDTVLITHLGYEDKTIYIEAKDFEQVLFIILHDKKIALDQVVITNHIKSLNVISEIDLQTHPVNSSQEILRKVPGLIIGQHAGGGKAEQIFLRGFDTDHGTDIHITVDGIPINMVSHAHGQGYADLHFLIPETIEKIDFGKGPYYADKGNFSTAGYVDFKTKDRLEHNVLGYQYGKFNTIRTVALVNLFENIEKQQAYLAGEYLLTEGAFESPQNFNRINLTGKYTASFSNYNKLSFLVSHFNSKWDASGQIPQRAVDAGMISRFGAIDDTEGGNTSRTNVALNFCKFINENNFVKSRAFYSNYNFELYSNFTFFLNDPVHGDQIRQKEQRNIFGAESIINQTITTNGLGIQVQGGIGFRYDNINGNELSHTSHRRITLEEIQLGNISESNIYGFINTEFDIGKWLINPALRLDYMVFDYVDLLDSAYQTQSQDQFFASPKFNIMYNHNSTLQFFLKSGIGFHSNDTRVVVARNGKKILPAAYGADIGTVWKPFPRLILNTALWYLFLEQEFVYVGDEGIVEPSGKTKRLGTDFGARCQILDWIFLDFDINYAFARSIDDPEGANYIPLAPDLTTTGGLAIHHPSGITGSIRYRYLKDRPANEDNSIVAKGYWVTDMNASYHRKKWEIGIIIENLFNTAWNETQFATESRLQNETESVEEIHFIPGTPFMMKAKLEYRF